MHEKIQNKKELELELQNLVEENENLLEKEEIEDKKNLNNLKIRLKEDLQDKKREYNKLVY